MILKFLCSEKPDDQSSFPETQSQETNGAAGGVKFAV
jgi:hypothetical protein